LLRLPLLENSDDFVFDNQMLAQAIRFGFRVGELSCPTSYHDASSSIGFARAIAYGLGCLRTSGQHLLARLGWARPAIFDPEGRKLDP
ncbi:MAG: glycosyltransferase family 2 protein, partial [Acidobacteria bacterium]|nr:glycosyltransferase family 2 protein [Acidobacteriota bacterium]